MAQWLDFSDQPPGAAAIKQAGYMGVLRYIGLGSEGKQIHHAEYQDYVDHGLGVLLVAELGVNDAWAALDDYATGVARAQLALADARAEGIPDTVGIACAADAHATSATQIDDAVRYAAGVASVLGRARAGFYGFRETSQAVHAAGVVGWHWRCGSEPSLEDKTWVNFWQRNTPPQVVVINGTACDINETYAPLPEDNMALDPYELGALERTSYRTYAIMTMAEQIDQPLSEKLADGSNARLQETNEVAKRINALEDSVAEIHTMLTGFIGQGVHLGATGEIIVKASS